MFGGQTGILSEGRKDSAWGWLESGNTTYLAIGIGTIYDFEVSSKFRLIFIKRALEELSHFGFVTKDPQSSSSINDYL